MNNDVLKWVATAILIVGTGINSLGYYPVGPLVLLSGGIVWLIVSIRWKEPSLVATNAVMSLTSAASLLYTYFK